MALYDSYIICTSPRSGSTLLCSLLAATGLSGNPESYFHRPSLSAWLRHFELSPSPDLSEEEILQMIFKAALKAGRRGGIFGCRLQRHSFDFFVNKLSVLYPSLTKLSECLEATFGRVLYIHLTRCDKVEQAVSYVKAEQTGLWHKAPDGTELERLTPPKEPVYNENQIRTSYEEMVQADHDWKRWFEAEQITPLRITYTALASHPKETLTKILNVLGVDSKAIRGVEPGVAKLADAISADWVSRFRSAIDSK